MRRTGKAKAGVWRWQARYLEAGVDGLLRDQDPAVAHSAAGDRSGRAGGRPHPAAAARRGHPLDRARDGQGHRHLARLGAADLGGARAAAAPGQDLQAVHRPGVRRQAARRGRALRRPAGACRSCCRSTRRSQIQALDRTQPGLPMKKGRAGTMTHDYKRNGTTTLFAALNVLDGSVIGQCMQRHRHQEFIRRAPVPGRRSGPTGARCRPRSGSAHRSARSPRARRGAPRNGWSRPGARSGSRCRRGSPPAS